LDLESPAKGGGSPLAIDETLFDEKSFIVQLNLVTELTDDVSDQDDGDYSLSSYLLVAINRVAQC
jgi:hypothetical protein